MKDARLAARVACKKKNRVSITRKDPGARKSIRHLQPESAPPRPQALPSSPRTQTSPYIPLSTSMSQCSASRRERQREPQSRQRTLAPESARTAAGVLRCCGRARPGVSRANQRESAVAARHLSARQLANEHLTASASLDGTHRRVVPRARNGGRNEEIQKVASKSHSERAWVRGGERQGVGASADHSTQPVEKQRPSTLFRAAIRKGGRHLLEHSNATGCSQPG